MDQEAENVLSSLLANIIQPLHTLLEDGPDRSLILLGGKIFSKIG